MTEFVFLTFADSRMDSSRARICHQARRMGSYSRIIGAKETDLDPHFQQHFARYLNSETRGFGYWCWKPQIILQALHSMNEGDVLHWVDAGCHLNPRGKWRLKEYLKMAESSRYGVLGFRNSPPLPPFPHDGRELPSYPDIHWTKGDLLDRLGVRADLDLLNQSSIGATIIMVRKCTSSVSLVKEWLSIPYEDFSLIDDSPSRSENLEGFREHRHDQSIFSLLGKLKPIDTVSVFESWYPRRDDMTTPDWPAVRNYPIHIRRDRGFKERNQQNLIQRSRAGLSSGKNKLKKVITGLLRA